MGSNSSTSSARFEIQITSTAKSYRPDDEYRIIDQHRIVATSIEDVREQLRELYGDCKRVPMYADRPNGQPEQVGWVYCFNNDDNVRGEIKKWRQQDWVQVMQVRGKLVDPSALKR